MQLAINYSPAAARLIHAGTIDINCFKTPDWDWLVKEAQSLRPVAVHFTLDAGNGGLDRVDWESIKLLTQSTQTPFINLHLDCRKKHFPEIAIDSNSRSDVSKLLSSMIADVMYAIDIFGADRVIIENSPYRGKVGNTLRACVDPAIISKVVRETGCGFLLDISHACISAYTLDMQPKAYFSQLPVDQIKELHFAGIHRLEGELKDHLSILKRDWKRLDWVLQRIQVGDWRQPWMLAFEYGGVGEEFAWRSDPRVIAEQVPCLMEKLSEHQLK